MQDTEKRTIIDLHALALNAASHWEKVWASQYSGWLTSDLSEAVRGSIDQRIEYEINSVVESAVEEAIERSKLQEKARNAVNARISEIADKQFSRWVRESEFFNDPPSEAVVAAIRSELEDLSLRSGDYLDASRRMRLTALKLSLSGQSNEAIAEHLNCKVGAVGKMIARARHDADIAKANYQMYFSGNFPIDESAPDFASIAALTGIEQLWLSTRVENSLKAEGIYTVGEVANASELRLLRIPNIGKKAIKEIHTQIEEFRSGLLPERACASNS